ncbi:MAG: hypothetical protein JNG84_10065, partial [Archangium sp.]|nr:hypothetical protein [Archangium sp.]
MAVNSALQQLGGGVAAGATGLIVVEAADGALLHYEVLGYVVATAIILSTAVLFFVDRRVRQRTEMAGARPDVSAAQR